MMELRKKIKINKCFIVFVVIGFITTCATNEPYLKEDLITQEKLKEVIKRLRATDTTYIDLKTLTQFDWDKLTILTPYTDVDSIDALLGFHWPQSRKLGIDETESYNVLIFSKGDSVISWFKFNRSNGDFAKVKSHSFMKSTAIFNFRIDSTNIPPWIYLEN